MNEDQFLSKWLEEKGIYDAWGECIVATVSNAVASRVNDTTVFFKISPKHRLKDDSSLLDKAFFRGKNYEDPYSEIEDKVGARFVVLLLDELDLICKIINDVDLWDADNCRHFQRERDENPLLFAYQSVHYILRPTNDLSYNGVDIPAGTPCEVQVRTLLQHAHAELTHDAVYKAKRAVKPMVHRTVARSMALIETTDEFFKQVSNNLNEGPLQEYSVVERLDKIYQGAVGIPAVTHKSSLVVWDVYESLIDENLVSEVLAFYERYPFLSGIIASRYEVNPFFQQSVILFVYWMLKRKRARLLSDWPLADDLLKIMGADIGVRVFED